MPEKQKPPQNYARALDSLMEQANGPVSVETLVDQMLFALPSTSRSPQSAMHKHILAAVGHSLVFVDAATVLPVRLAFKGARFRLPLDREHFDQFLLPWDFRMASMLPASFPPERLSWVDAAGQTISAPYSISTPEPGGAGDFNLDSWFRSEQVKVNDHILITILDWSHGVLQLEREPYAQHDPVRQAGQDQAVADMFFALLESAMYDDIHYREALPTVYARLPKGGYPPSNWIDILNADKRMSLIAGWIRYADQESFGWDSLSSDAEAHAAPASTELSPAERQQVYRFKAKLLDMPSKWRKIELQGEHTLADLDHELRIAFQHDTFDHLSSFTLRVPRPGHSPLGSVSKKRQRFREIFLENINPFDDGTGSSVPIAGLNIPVGSQIIHVYDFGDWIEHLLTLEAIEPPKEGVTYPRETARNKPKYSYCVTCQQTGKQEIATWVCLYCSSPSGRPMYTCDTCAEQHENHPIREIVY